jgi:hypothetical protein
MTMGRHSPQRTADGRVGMARPEPFCFLSLNRGHAGHLQGARTMRWSPFPCSVQADAAVEDRRAELDLTRPSRTVFPAPRTAATGRARSKQRSPSRLRASPGPCVRASVRPCVRVEPKKVWPSVGRDHRTRPPRPARPLDPRRFRMDIKQQRLARRTPSRSRPTDVN